MKCFSMFILFLFVQISTAQINAVTDQGDEVVLFKSGTWEYKTKKEDNAIIPLNSKIFKTPKESTFLLKSKKIDCGLYLNPKLWEFKNAENNPEAEFELKLKTGDLYAMIINEKIEIPLETLRKAAIENAENAAPDLKVIQEEYRMVNGIKVLFMQMNGTISDIKFSYYGYYFSTPKGSVQLITYTSQNLLEEYKPFAEELLNGVTEIK